MKKIAYIEIDTHAEIAQDFIEIMQDSHEFEVDYYFSQKIKNQIKESKENVFLSDSSMIIDQLKFISIIFLKRKVRKVFFTI